MRGNQGMNSDQNIKIANLSIINNKAILETVKLDLKKLIEDVDDLKKDIFIIKQIVEAKQLRESKKWFL
tara:strand:- start:96 stop:302 length:207 start_codon:yes stop_codon:yes gene_type:complete